MPRRRRAGSARSGEPYEPQPPGGPDHDGGRRRYDPAWDDWRTPRRWPGVLISCIIVLGFIGVVVWHFHPHTKPHRPPILKSLVSHQPPYVPGPGAKVTTFTGDADAASLSYGYDGQLLVMHASCACTYNFVVTISNSTGTPVSAPINVTGPYLSTLNISGGLPGRYTLTVNGSGPWKIQLIQPAPTLHDIAVPFKYFSEGNSVIGPFSSADRSLALRFLSFTDGYVFVHILNQNGAAQGLAFIGRGELEHSLVLNDLPDPYYLEIDASGFWSLRVQPAPAP